MQGSMPSTTANSERRHNSRKRPPSLIYVELGSANGGMMRDLSEDGFAVRAMMPLHVAEGVSFSFLLDPLTRIEGQGEVLWAEESGRVAGVRFIDLSSVARTDIRSWLNDELETQEAQKNAAAAADAPSFEKLREELRSAPPRVDSPKPKANKSKWPVVPSETVPESPAFIPEDTLSAAGPAGMHRAGLGQSTRENPERSLDESGSLSGLPSSSITQKPIELSFETVSPPNTPVRPAFPSEQAPRRSEVAPFPNRSGTPSPKGPTLPDISEILMHPPRRESFAANPPRLEPLDPVYQRRGMPGGSRTEGFTLSKALTVMVLLALVVGLLVYHDTVGQSLIWLGHQIGGNQENQTVSPLSNNEPASGEVNSPASSAPAANAPPASSAVLPDKNQVETNDAASHPDPKPQPSLPAIENKPPPPVTPLSGISSQPPSDSAPEAGQTEYTQATQLLHDGIATDTSEAVRLLWISVEKGNPNAELTLAELYWRGQGVARNCDQTGILLGAAARKGNADAQKRLRQFRREGCE
jgi:PilZ domain